jgi:hypothetical protein
MNTEFSASLDVKQSAVTVGLAARTADPGQVHFAAHGVAPGTAWRCSASVRTYDAT